MAIIKTFVLGAIATNCYLVFDEKTLDAVIIDPSVGTDLFTDEIVKNKLNLKYIINTHGHIDHIAGNNFLKDFQNNAKIAIHKLDAECLTNGQKNLSSIFGENLIGYSADILLQEGDILEFGNQKLKILETPGHTLGSISLILNDEAIFTGDTLFNLSIGRTDLPHASDIKMQESLKKLKGIDKDLKVYSGHGSDTTLYFEIKNNEYLK